MYLISEFRKKRLDGQFDNFHKAIFNVNVYQLEWLSGFADYEEECVRFMHFMKIQDPEDEYARNGQGLLGKIKELTRLKGQSNQTLNAIEN